MSPFALRKAGVAAETCEKDADDGRCAAEPARGTERSRRPWPIRRYRTSELPLSTALAGMGARRRFADKPFLPLVLAGKVVFDALGGLHLNAEEQATKRRRFCSW